MNDMILVPAIEPNDTSVTHIISQVNVGPAPQKRPDHRQLNVSTGQVQGRAPILVVRKVQCDKMIERWSSIRPWLVRGLWWRLLRWLLEVSMLFTTRIRDTFYIACFMSWQNNNSIKHRRHKRGVQLGVTGSFNKQLHTPINDRVCRDKEMRLHSLWNGFQQV